MTPTSVNTWGPYPLWLGESLTGSPNLAQASLAQTPTLAQEQAPTTGQPPAGNGNGTGNGTTGQQTAPGPFGGGGFMLMILFVIVFMLIMSTMAGRKDKKKRESLLAALSKGDRVQTVGGMLGTVVEIKDNEVLLKVDENANTKIKFVRSAIQNILTDKTPDETPEEPAK